MLLHQLDNIICTKGTISEDTIIRVLNHTDRNLLWEGKAKDLPSFDTGVPWIVVSFYPDKSDIHTKDMSDWNKRKIITVI